MGENGPPNTHSLSKAASATSKGSEEEGVERREGRREWKRRGIGEERGEGMPPIGESGEN